MRRLPARLLAGSVAGLVATIPMTALMVAWHRRLTWPHRDPLPPAQITDAALSGIGLADDLPSKPQTALALVNHLAYGSAMGGIYGAISRGGRPAGALPAGIAFGLTVWAGSYLGYLPAFGLYRPVKREPAERLWMMVAAHVVWGASLGLFTEFLAERPAGHDQKHRQSPHQIGEDQTLPERVPSPPP